MCNAISSRIRSRAWAVACALACMIGATPEVGAESGVRYFSAAALSPDGSFLAFSAEPAAGGWTTLDVLSVRSRISRKLPGQVRFQPPVEGERNAQPQWSANGRYLAYVASDDGVTNLLRVWDRTTENVVSIDEVAPCGRGQNGCQRNSLEWTRDSKRIVMLGIPPDSTRAPPRLPPRSVPSVPADVEVQTSVVDRAAVTAGAGSPADIYVIDVERKRAFRQTTGGRFLEVILSPDESQALGVQRGRYEISDAKQSYLDLYLIELPVRLRSSPSTSTSDSGVMGSRGRSLPRLLETRQSLRLISWSPRSDALAIIEQGAFTDGDILLFDLKTRVFTNAARASSFGSTSDIDAEHQLRDFRYPGSKFGSSILPAIWAETGRHLLISRRAKERDGWRTSPWLLDLDSGSASLIADIAGCDLQHFIPDDTESFEAITALYYCRSGETRLYALKKGQPNKLLARVEGDRPVSASLTRSGAVALVTETRQAPPEVWLYSRGAKAFDRITAVNAQVTQSPVVAHDITWSGTEGQQLSGTLYHAADAKPSGLPLIVYVYPRDTYRPKRTSFRFPVLDRLLMKPLPELVASGYAVFRPEVSVAGGGRTCEVLASDLERSLPAVSAAGLADTRRAGIIGESFGGWSVNCLVTRSHTFKAAVSVAGISDLISLHFSRVGQSWPRGGGQTSIGATLSDDPLAFWKESPVSALSRVSTPLLLIHGRQDTTVPFEQSAEMFHGLSELGKDATLVLYREGNHTSVTEHADYGPRVKSWFDAHLGVAATSGP
jgi:dipeptidyl aminopeptidase/acylaminoacyl peptidase